MIIENNSCGIPLLQEFSRGELGMPRAIPFTPEKDKITRMYAKCAKIESGQVLLPRDATWLAAFRNELLQFLHGKNDDQVDAFSQLLARIGQRTEDRFEADFGYRDCVANPRPVPASTLKPNILVQREVGGQLKLVCWDPTEGFGS